MKTRVIVPRDVSMDLTKMQDIFRQAADKSGHPMCVSRMDTEFDIEEDFMRGIMEKEKDVETYKYDRKTDKLVKESIL